MRGRGQLLQHTAEHGTAHWTLAVVVRGSIRKRLEAANARSGGEDDREDDDAGKIWWLLRFFTCVAGPWSSMVSEIKIFKVR